MGRRPKHAEVENNIIKVTQCDNQLIIFAVSSNEQRLYQVARVGSGLKVSVEIVIEEGTFLEPEVILNPEKPISMMVELPADTYSIYYTGFNAGGPFNYQFTLNGEPHELKNKPDQPMYGFVWNLASGDPSEIKLKVEKSR